MKNTIISVVAVLALVVAGMAFLKPAVVERVVGGSNSPSVVDGCMDVNGMNLCTYRQAMTNASTTCTFRAVASSTLMYAAAHITNAQGAGFDLEFGKSLNLSATTTRLGYQGVMTANKAVTASSSPVNGGDTITQRFSAGDYLNVKIGTTTVSSGLRGTCTAVFWQI